MAPLEVAELVVGGTPGEGGTEVSVETAAVADGSAGLGDTAAPAELLEPPSLGASCLSATRQRTRAALSASKLTPPPIHAVADVGRIFGLSAAADGVMLIWVFKGSAHQCR